MTFGWDPLLPQKYKILRLALLMIIALRCCVTFYVTVREYRKNFTF